ncbi:MAG TPA: OB-fold domain-containing protein [Nitrososphaerales archaeon]|nr:OB-fold domain-containing protein [Nitrososphaerales archaeon]
MNLQIAELSKTGSVISFTEVYVKSKDFPLETPYTLALVKLDEGGNLLGVISGQTSKLTSGSKVSVIFKDVGEKVGWPRVFFELV